jgi:integrase
MGDIPAEQVTSEHLQELRKRLVATGLKPRTIESTVSDLCTIIAWQTGSSPDPGTRLTADHPEPRHVSVDEINAVWPLASSMLKGWIALAYWSAFRQTDAMKWLLEHRAKDIPDVIRLTAGKTRKHHIIPMPAWLRKILTENRYRLRTVSSFGKKCIRGEIHACCLQAGIPIWTPKHIRQTSITEWSRANPMAGGIIHGCKLGIMANYVASQVILESAAPRVRLPSCFGASNESGSEESLLLNFRRLDPAAQGLISGTAERLAAG